MHTTPDNPLDGRGAPRLTEAFGEHRGRRCLVGAVVVPSDSVTSRGSVVLSLSPIGEGPQTTLRMDYADALAVHEMLGRVLREGLAS